MNHNMNELSIYQKMKDPLTQFDQIIEANDEQDPCDTIAEDEN